MCPYHSLFKQYDLLNMLYPKKDMCFAHDMVYVSHKNAFHHFILTSSVLSTKDNRYIKYHFEFQ